jgi:hypothetical protein
MFRDLKPVAMTQVDWPTFIGACQDHLGYSPTRGLDEYNIDPKDIASYALCLDFENRPQEALKHPRYILEHVSFSFICVCDQSLLFLLATVLHLEVVVKPIPDSTDRLCIVTGSMHDWHRVIAGYSNDQQSTDIRMFLNECMTFFEQTRFSQLWSKQNKTYLTDGTFTLR